MRRRRTRSRTPRREFGGFVRFSLTHCFCSPKIQRLVTPLRLQRRRHLRSLKRRRIEHQKEQKTEYDTLIAKRVADKKAKAAAIKAGHKTT